MERQHGTFELIKGDITSLHCDVIVNAANESLLRGGGVCGCIHRVAGPRMEIECISKAPCPTGSFKFTGAYNLPCKEVAHAVGPIWQGGTNQEAEKLANCYEEVIKAAYEKGYCSVAFPFISSNIFGYPREECANVALTSIRKMIEIYPVKVIMCAYSDEDYKLFQDVRSGLDHYLTINTKKAADKKSDVKAKSTFVEKLTLSEFKMCTNQEFRRIVSRKIAGWYSEEAFKVKAIERMVLQREKIIDLLASTHRQGITEVIEYLDKSGFFYRASSSYKHHNFPGGLAEHSLGTYHESIADPESRNLPEDSIIIATLLHDICKADRFWFKGRIINEHRQYGLDSKHSARSVALLKSCGLDLTEDERLAIRWHMKGDRYHSKDPRKENEHSKAVKTPLWKVVFFADKRDAGKHPGQVRSDNRKGSSKL